MKFCKKVILNLVTVLLLCPQLSLAAIHNTTNIPGKNVGSKLNISEFNTIVEAVKSFFRDDSNGNVGIGTSSPSTTLDVAGTVTATAFVGDGTGLTGLGAGKFVDGVNTNDAVYETGNVGVGTSTPSTELEVAGTVTATSFVGDGTGLTGIASAAIATNAIQDAEMDYTQVTLIDFTNDAGFINSGSVNDLSTATLACTANQIAKYDGAVWACAADENDAVWADNAGDISYVAGNVGIGTSTPNQPLTVVGNMQIDTDTLFVDSTNNRVGIGLTNPSTALEVNGTVTATTFVGDGSSLTGVSGKFIDGADPNDAAYVTGNVGIGTTSPLAKLHLDTGATTEEGLIVKGVASQTANLTEWQDSTGTVMSVVDENGNIGIGTDSPSEELHINGDGKATRFLSENFVSPFDGNTGYRFDSFFNPKINAVTNYNILFTIDDVEKMRVDSSGNIGIGEATPLAKLHIDTGGTTEEGLIVKGVASQTANLFEAQDSLGNVKVAIDTTEQLRLGYDSTNYWSDVIASDGGRTITGNGTDSDLNINLSGGAGADLNINTDHISIDTSLGRVGVGIAAPSIQRKFHVNSGATDTGIRLQSSDPLSYIEVMDSDGTMKFGTNRGDLYIQVQGGASIGDVIVDSPNGYMGLRDGSPSARLHSNAYDTATIPIIAEGVSGQTADLTQWIGSTGTLSVVDANGSIGIGTATPQSKLTVDGGTSFGVTEVDSATYTIAISDRTVAVDYTTTGTVTLTLPSAATCFVGGTGCEFNIKDSGCNAGTNNITINRAGTDTIIDSATGQTSITMSTNCGSLWIQAKDATTWITY